MRINKERETAVDIKNRILKTEDTLALKQVVTN